MTTTPLELVACREKVGIKEEKTVGFHILKLFFFSFSSIIDKEDVGVIEYNAVTYVVTSYFLYLLRNRYDWLLSTPYRGVP